jgi:hypothetical protein
MASNSGDSSSAPTKSSLHILPYNSHPPTPNVFITFWHGPRRQHCSFLYSNSVHENVLFVKALLSNGCIYLLIKDLLLSSGYRFIVGFDVVTQ